MVRFMVSKFFYESFVFSYYGNIWMKERALPYMIRFMVSNFPWMVRFMVSKFPYMVRFMVTKFTYMVRLHISTRVNFFTKLKYGRHI